MSTVMHANNIQPLLARAEEIPDFDEICQCEPITILIYYFLTFRPDAAVQCVLDFGKHHFFLLLSSICAHFP
jgi:hypothetical protein